MFGPYDGGSIVGDRNANQRSMNLYIVKIPCKFGVPQDSRRWEWISIQFNIGDANIPFQVPRCGALALGDMAAPTAGGVEFWGNGLGDGVGGGGPPAGGGVVASPPFITVNKGDALGIYIGKQQLYYTKTNSSTNLNFLISPATFSISVIPL